jgi:phosphoribosylformylglycinamidine synthase subunit PurL
VSFYNQTGEQAILPTPVVGVLGVIDDVSTRVRHGWRTPGAEIHLLGTTREEFGGSEWAHVVHGHLGGTPPTVDLDAERALADVLIEAGRAGLVEAAHDLSDGGLAQAVVECCLSSGLGARLTLPAELGAFVALFSESSARAVVAVRTQDSERFAELCAGRGLPSTRIGVVEAAGDAAALVVEDSGTGARFDVSLADLRAAWSATLPGLYEQG